MKHLLLSSVTLTALLATSCSSDDPIAVNPDPVGNAITFSPLVNRNTRATETTILNLGDFGVFALGVDSRGSLYPNYIFGSATAPDIATKKNLNSESTEGYWNVEGKTVVWPSDVDRINFWALTSLGTDDNKENYNENVLFGNSGSLSFGTGGPEIAGFSPYRADRKDRTKPYADGVNQRDLVGAFTSQLASDGKSNIKLAFMHELSQIRILAKSNDGKSDSRRVYVKGAWIVNANSVSDFKAHYAHNEDSYTDDAKWENLAKKVKYGTHLTKAVKLTEEPKDILSEAGVFPNGSLMLIPQTVEAWDGNPNRLDNQKTTDAYILVYCRIELEHDGETHEGGGSGIHSENGKHYHQLFPVLKADEEFNRESYGYTCVPVKFDWKRGIRYTYTLNICGEGSGGGVYPPEDPDPDPELPEEPDRPEDKEPGDPVLDDPISFTVTVGEWTNDDVWKPGGSDLDFK